MISVEALRSHASRWALDLPYDPEKELSVCQERGIQLLALQSPAYPEMLRSVPDPPAVLYAQGAQPMSGKVLAIIGSRRPSPYGRRMARLLAAECAREGIVVVSGLARGIDTQAHQAALEAGGNTWAVLGSGLDRVYPPENRELARTIAQSGGILFSEVPLTGAPVASNFPRRNRIISGLAWGVVVVEGDLKSGSLITARAALEQGREVFAVPGLADSTLSAGPNYLLDQGAHMARSLEDILRELPMLRGQEGSRAGVRQAAPLAADCELQSQGDTAEEQKILKLLGSQALGLEELMSETGWDAALLLRLLTDMETKDLIIPRPGQRYARAE